MNAYELAEQLMTALATLENSAIMLRQQADRIAELEKEKGQVLQTIELIEQQADRIAELEKEKQNYKYDPETGEPLIDGYPLYSGLPTPQTKPLSDEEIVEIYESVKQDKDLTWEEWCITWEEWCKEQIEFARAIEERILGK